MVCRLVCVVFNVLFFTNFESKFCDVKCRIDPCGSLINSVVGQTAGRAYYVILIEDGFTTRVGFDSQLLILIKWTLQNPFTVEEGGISQLHHCLLSALKSNVISDY